MTPESYRFNLSFAWALAHTITRLPVGEMLTAIQRADASAAILDPTLYRANARRMEQDAAMLQSLAGVQAALAPMAASTWEPRPGIQTEAVAG